MVVNMVNSRLTSDGELMNVSQGSQRAFNMLRDNRNTRISSLERSSEAGNPTSASVTCWTMDTNVRSRWGMHEHFSTADANNNNNTHSVRVPRTSLRIPKHPSQSWEAEDQIPDPRVLVIIKWFDQMKQWNGSNTYSFPVRQQSTTTSSIKSGLAERQHLIYLHSHRKQKCLSVGVRLFPTDNLINKPINKQTNKSR